MDIIETKRFQTSEHQKTYIPTLQRDVDSIRDEITTEATNAEVSLDAIQEKIAESAAAIETNQLALKEAKTTKEKAKSMETLVCIPL